MKRLTWLVFCTVLAICILFMFPAEAQAAEIVDSGTCGENQTWTLDDAGVLTITGTGDMTDFAMRRPIPDVIPPWYDNHVAIQQVIIESGITSIGTQAFEGCTNLSAVSIPDTVQTIGTYAFQSCSSLRSICIPEGVVSIDGGAFLGCYNIRWIELPQSLQTIGSSAFKNPDTWYLGRHIVYAGSKSQWDQLDIGDYNTILTSDIGATRHYNASARLTQKETCSLLCLECSSCGNFAAMKKPTHNHEFNDGVCATCGVDENWQYGLTSEGKIQIAGYSGDEPYLIIPSYIEGYPVERLASYPIYPNKDTLLAIYIPSSVKYIGGGVSYFPNLKHVLYGGGRNDWDSAVTSTVSSATRYHFYSNSSKVSYVETCETILLDCTDCGCFLTQKKTTNDHVFTEGVCTKCDTEEGWEYTVTKYRDVIITGYTGAKTEVTVPTQIEGMPVIAIGENAFQNNVNLEAVTIAPGVVRIGKSAFAGCSGLKHVTIPSSLIMAQESAFSGCVALEDVHIEDLSAWCNIVFDNSAANPLFYADMLYVAGQQMTNLVIPEGVDAIAAYAFCGYTGMTAVNISSSITNIDTSAFSSCDGLTTITIPDNVINIGDGAFADCSNLERIYFGKNVKDIGSRAFVNCEKLVEISIPDSVTAVGASAFAGCSNLERIYFGKNVKDIGSEAFIDCEKLVEISIPDSVTAVGASAFYGCSGITTITLGSGVQTIGANAFARCDNLETINLQSIEAWQLVNIENDLADPMKVGSRDKKLQVKGESVTDLIIPEGVKTIRSGAFLNCTEIQSVHFPDTIEKIDSSAFYQCKNLKTVDFGNGIKYIYGAAFSGCSALETVVLPDGLKILSSRAFSYCSSLSSVYLGKSLITLGELAFFKCESLREITIPGGVSTIGKSAFEGCTELRDVVIEPGVVSIGNSAFYNCTWLNTIVIPGTVKLVGQSAFYLCQRLEHVYYLGTESQWNSINATGNATYPLESARMHYIIESDCGNNHYTCLTCNLSYNEQGELLRTYAITFLNWDGTELSKQIYHYGDAVIAPDDPSRGTDSSCTYTFAGWDAEITICQGDATYTAIYDAEYIEYTVEFRNWDGAVISRKNYHYGETILAPTNVGRPADKIYAYKFIGWDQDATVCQGNVVCTAVYQESLVNYTVIFQNYDGSVISSKTYHYGDTVEIPVVTVTPSDKVYYYYFIGWDSDVTTCQGNMTYTAAYSTEYIEYTVTFKNWDGSVISSATYHYGETIEVPATPQKPADQTNTYAFVGWSADVTVCEGDATYTAMFTPSNVEYIVVFKNYDGSIISSKVYHYGDTVTVPADPTKAADNTCIYIFAGWDSDVVDCDGNATYTATYTSSYINYTVIFKDWNGTVLSTKTYHYGDKVTAPADPTKAADNTYTYTFAGWNKEVVNCVGSATYTATYDSTFIDYTVIFVDEDGAEISKKTYHWGEEVTAPADPTKAADNTYTYAFKGWDNEVVNCAGDATYTATYTPTYINYTVVFKNWNGDVLSTKTYHYGDVVIAPTDPTKAADNTYTYAFAGWDKEVVDCAGNATYTATYTSTYIDYTVVFKNWNGTVISTKTYHYGDTVTAPSVPTRPNDSQYSYTFTGWDKAVVNCAGNATYTAVYSAKSLIPSTITSSKHTVSGGIISKIGIGTKAETLLGNLGEGRYASIYQGNTAVAKSALIGTGMTVKIMDGNTVKATATIVVTGDTNGDGKITITDMLAAKAHILKKSALNGAYSKAADTNGDGSISITDFIQLKAHILGKSKVEPKSVVIRASV